MPMKKKDSRAIWIFGGSLLIFICAIIFLLPEPTKFQWAVVTFLIALCAAFLSYFIVGKVIFRGSILGQKISAVGGIALFLIILFLWNPMDIKTYMTDIVPSIVPSTTIIQEAQVKLKEKGYYSGPITGKPDYRTRSAIERFQIASRLKPTGIIFEETSQALQIKKR